MSQVSSAHQETVIATALANCDMCDGPHDIEEERIHARKAIRALEVNGYRIVRAEGRKGDVTDGDS